MQLNHYECQDCGRELVIVKTANSMCRCNCGNTNLNLIATEQIKKGDKKCLEVQMKSMMKK